MNSQFVPPASRFRIRTPLIRLRKVGGEGMYTTEQEYVVAAYRHWEDRTVRLDLAVPEVLNAPLEEGDPGLYYQSNQLYTPSYLIVNDLRHVQVEICGSPLIDIDPTFTSLALEKRLVITNSKRPRFYAEAIEVVKLGPQQFSARLQGRSKNNRVRFTHMIDEPYRVGDRLVSRLPAENFHLTIRRFSS